MKAWPYLLTIILTCVITALAYLGVSLFLFKVSEPRSGYPVKNSTGIIYIRNDSLGDGQFGARRGNGRSHNGIDFRAKTGTPVYAAKSGIAFAGKVPSGYGKYVMIYGFANGSFFIVGSPGHEYLQPGLGYWIACTSAGTIYP